MNQLPLNISIYLYTSETQPPKIVGFLSVGEFVYWTEEPRLTPHPDAEIDVFYEDIREYEEMDLRLAAERAIMTAMELWHVKMQGLKTPKGHVTLIPRHKWRGHEQDAVSEVQRLIARVANWLKSHAAKETSGNTL